MKEMTKSFIFIVLGMFLLAGAARADMSYAPYTFNALDLLGNPIGNGTFAVVVDLDGNGWAGNSYTTASSGSATSWLWDSNDLLLEVGRIEDGMAFAFTTIKTAAIPATFTAGVDNYYLLWFDKAFDAAAAGPGFSTNYGVADLGKVGTDPGDYGPEAAGGSATLSTVAPEPVSTTLALLGGAAMFLRRRFGQLSV